jgi:N-acetylglutamate synthase-like GNAT family acetyltransferase
MIRKCTPGDLAVIYSIINEAAAVYKGVIPTDCWKEPYMPDYELRQEIEHGVEFWGCEQNGELVGVMGIQHVLDVTLIRHAYVCKNLQDKGVGGQLLAFLLKQTQKPILIGTWRDAYWAINFYEKHGFVQVTGDEKDRLLKKYWLVSDRQIQNSVVLQQKQ